MAQTGGATRMQMYWTRTRLMSSTCAAPRPQLLTKKARATCSLEIGCALPLCSTFYTSKSSSSMSKCRLSEPSRANIRMATCNPTVKAFNFHKKKLELCFHTHRSSRLSSAANWCTEHVLHSFYEFAIYIQNAAKLWRAWHAMPAQDTATGPKDTGNDTCTAVGKEAAPTPPPRT